MKNYAGDPCEGVGLGLVVGWNGRQNRATNPTSSLSPHRPGVSLAVVSR